MIILALVDRHYPSPIDYLPIPSIPALLRDGNNGNFRSHNLAVNDAVMFAGIRVLDANGPLEMFEPRSRDNYVLCLRLRRGYLRPVPCCFTCVPGAPLIDEIAGEGYACCNLEPRRYVSSFGPCGCVCFQIEVLTAIAS
jgi:hypothetical protein